jgi:hypothetical protein
VKPSLGFFQGLAVVIAIVAARRRSLRFAWARQTTPALITWTVLAAILSVSFGSLPLVKTYLPSTGMAVYRFGNFGFFGGIGRDFWLLPNAGLRDYFRYEVRFWMLGTAVLIWAAVAGLRRLMRGNECEDRATADEIVVSCASAHIAFVVFLFGHRETWLYSFPMLVLVLATLAPRGRWHRSVLWVLAVLLLVNDRSKAMEVLRHYRTEAPSESTLNLWANPTERTEWELALELTRGRQPILLAMCEGSALHIPGFEPPVVGYLVPGNALPGEVARKAAQLATAPMIISAQPPDWPGFRFWPEITAAMRGCEIVMEGRCLRVYRRTSPRHLGSKTSKTRIDAAPRFRLQTSETLAGYRVTYPLSGFEDSFANRSSSIRRYAAPR